MNLISPKVDDNVSYQIKNITLALGYANSMKKIALFSSDSATLYKKDVFRIMGLQEDFVIHFRYGTEHFSVGVDEVKKAIGHTVIIFFTHGNDLGITDKSLRNITSIPLREAVIVDVTDNADTGLVHIYLQLKGFVDCTYTVPDPAKQPPYFWVSEIESVNIKVSSWHERITALRSQFADQLFYKLELFDQKHAEKISPKYSKEQFSSFYLVEDESSYLLDIAFYDTSSTASETSQKLMYSTEDKDALKFNAPHVLEVGARRDNRTYSLFTQVISSKKGYSYLNFESVNGNVNPANPPAVVALPNDIQLPFQIGKNRSRAFYFSLYTVLAAISVGYSKMISDKWDLKGTFDPVLLLHCIGALAIGLIAFYKLYELFNKK
jgi:hypothetical protein